MPRPRKITDEMRAEIIEVGRRRRELRQLPTTKELARRAGCSERAVEHVMYGRDNVRDGEVSTWNIDELAEEVEQQTAAAEVDAILESSPHGTFDDEPEVSD